MIYVVQFIQLEHELRNYESLVIKRVPISKF